jgi:phage/plasmid-like protein (TIGR03299 family)
MPAEYDRGVYAKKPAWHRFGEVKTDFFTAQEAIDSLDPSGEGVIKANIKLVFVDSKGVEHRIDMPQKVGLVDWDEANQSWRPQSVMDKDYGLVQLGELFAFMDAVIGMVDGAHYDAAVKLRKGRQTVLSAYMGNYVLDPNGIADRQEKFLWGFNSLDGSWALRLKKGEFRIECANMAAMALRGSTDEVKIGTDWSTRHTQNVMNRVEEAKSALQMWHRHDVLFQAQAEHMIQTPIHDNAFDRIVTGLYTDINPKTNQSEADREAIETVRMTYELGKSTRDITGTVWGAFNAVTEYEDWLVKVRAGRSAGEAEKRLVRQLEDPDDRKQHAWDRMWDYAEDAKKFVMPDLA